MRIQRIDLYLTTPGNAAWRWSNEKPEQHMANLFVRICTDEGIEGVAGIPVYSAYGYDKSVIEAVASLRPGVIGKDPLQREQLWRDLRSGYVQLPTSAVAAIDIALWDIAARAANVPLYTLLGGGRERVQAYASTPTLPTLEAYYTFIDKMRELGFSACKLHVWGNSRQDIQLIQGLTKRFAGQMTFMFDAEGTYNRETALKIGRVLDEVGWEWFEMPLSDHDWTGYRWLCEQLEIPIVPGGYSFQDLLQYTEAFKREIWDIARINATLTGGLTLARKVAVLAEAFAQRIEIECFGFTLAQAANLHLILSIPHCRYFEMPVPYGPFDAYMLDIIRTDKDGYVSAPTQPGLGFAVDWERVHKEAIVSL